MVIADLIIRETQYKSYIISKKCITRSDRLLMSVHEAYYSVGDQFDSDRPYIHYYSNKPIGASYFLMHHIRYEDDNPRRVCYKYDWMTSKFSDVVPHRVDKTTGTEVYYYHFFTWRQIPTTEFDKESGWNSEALVYKNNWTAR